MLPNLQASSLPGDAIEVGRILDAWGVKGWIKILPYNKAPEALFEAQTWFLAPPEDRFGLGFSAFTGAVLLDIDTCKVHSDTVVAKAAHLDDRTAAESLRGARIFLPRSSFPNTNPDEYYWVDLIGLEVVNRQGLALGSVRDLMHTGPHAVLCITPPTAEPQDSAASVVERMIPFVGIYIDTVDLANQRIMVDWQADY